MGRGLALREDYDAGALRILSRKTRDASQSRRLLALAAVYEGVSREEAARFAGTDRQSVRDWVVRFNTEGPAGLVDRHGGGARSRLTPEILQAMRERIEAGPIAAVHGVVRWRLRDLCAWLHEDHGVTLSESHLSRVVRQHGFRLLTARPRHYAQNPDAQDIFKKTFPTPLPRSGRDILIKTSNSGGRTKHGSARKRS